MRRPNSPAREEDLLRRASDLSGQSVGELAATLGVQVPSDLRHSKGLMGCLAELALGSEPKAGDGPDFPHLGIELKTVPVDAAGIPT
ncbi:MAG: DNA mismatch repair protein MutH, partial [Deltaproteobacteria bacterium]|nr:DNA mismatch repair protein MutH [Deltaproteobacteria bacterium]